MNDWEIRRPGNLVAVQMTQAHYDLLLARIDYWRALAIGSERAMAEEFGQDEDEVERELRATEPK